ncbi:MAG TPA: AAA family ATPase, partial [Coxiellaceae bacterium]|nr:AAA family ATPase [Coxiellaceae bacterium]
MQRILFNSLINWKENPDHLPLILRGARQVGKTYLIEAFGKSSFKNLLTINFERDPQYKECFAELNPQKILMQLELLSGQKITSGESLVFFDEIQECPSAIQSLRYFKEEYPQLHVIGAGSLLEFTLHQAKFSMPVGRVQFLYLKPLSFKEFLWAQAKENLSEYLEQLNLNDDIPSAIHEELLTQIRLYLVLGGMPAVLNSYLANQSIQEARNIQTALLQSYRSDFGKYSKHHELAYLETVFTKLPALVSQQIKYKKLDPDALSRNLKAAIEK